MKKLLGLLIVSIILFSFMPVTSIQAAETSTQTVYMDNGDYIETTITIYPQTRSTNTKTAVKTSAYKNADNETLWSVSVTGTFSYEPGNSCICTNVSGESKSYNSAWKVSDAAVSKYANTATASATGTKYFLFVPTNSYDLSVTLTCDTYGNLS